MRKKDVFWCFGHVFCVTPVVSVEARNMGGWRMPWSWWRGGSVDPALGIGGRVCCSQSHRFFFFSFEGTRSPLPPFTFLSFLLFFIQHPPHHTANGKEVKGTYPSLELLLGDPLEAAVELSNSPCCLSSPQKSKAEKKEAAEALITENPAPAAVNERKKKKKDKKNKHKDKKQDGSTFMMPPSAGASSSSGGSSSSAPPPPVVSKPLISSSVLSNGATQSKAQTTAAPSRPTPSVATATSASLDDLAALDLFVAKEEESELDRLNGLVARLNKELEHKDAIIARLQDKVTSLLAGKGATAKIHDGDGESFDNALVPIASIADRGQQLRDAALQCGICVDYFASPFTVECGHTFCYTCLHSWLEIHKSCPTCRTKLLRRPTLSFNIREQVQSSLARLPEPEKKLALDKLAADEKSLKSKQKEGDLWVGLFKPLSLDGFGIGTIVDREDGVR